MTADFDTAAELEQARIALGDVEFARLSERQRQVLQRNARSAEVLKLRVLVEAYCNAGRDLGNALRVARQTAAAFTQAEKRLLEADSSLAPLLRLGASADTAKSIIAFDPTDMFTARISLIERTASDELNKRG